MKIKIIPNNNYMKIQISANEQKQIYRIKLQSIKQNIKELEKELTYQNINKQDRHKIKETIVDTTNILLNLYK